MPTPEIPDQSGMPVVAPAPRPIRRRLPDTRQSLTHKFNVAGHEGYLSVGMYEDGRPGELFITMSKEGSTISGLMDALGTAVSVALQYGVSVDALVNKFSHMRFEPCGMTENRDIPFAKSLVDYVFRWMGMQFIPGYRDAHAPRVGAPAEFVIEQPQGQDIIDEDGSLTVITGSFRVKVGVSDSEGFKLLAEPERIAMERHLKSLFGIVQQNGLCGRFQDVARKLPSGYGIDCVISITKSEP